MSILKCINTAWVTLIFIEQDKISSKGKIQELYEFRIISKICTIFTLFIRNHLVFQGPNKKNRKIEVVRLTKRSTYVWTCKCYIIAAPLTKKSKEETLWIDEIWYVFSWPTFTQNKG